jgi:hypothetical protein
MSPGPYALKIETNASTGASLSHLMEKKEHVTGAAEYPRVPYALASKVVSSINCGPSLG